MKIYIVLIASLIVFHTASAQIDMSDSTAQVIGYWHIGDQQTYSVTQDQYQVDEMDTTKRQIITYDVIVTVKDSTEHAYLIEWAYKNQKISGDNEILKRIQNVMTDMSIVIKTDEFGTLTEVVNWMEVRDYMKRSLENAKVSMSDIPNVDIIFAQVMSTFMSKELIEANGIKEIIQFYNFHGASYNLGQQITAQILLGNNYGGEPFDANLTIVLEELNADEDYMIIRMNQTTNSKQLTDETYRYLVKMGTLGEQPIARDQFPDLTDENNSITQIDGDTGWIIYSQEVKTVAAPGTINIAERTIVLK